MYLRRCRKIVDGESYEYWALVQSVRTASGPRQETVATLGKRPGLEEESRAGWEHIDELLEGQTRPRQLQLGQAGGAASQSPRWCQVDVAGVRVERVREFGQVYLPLALWRRLGLHRLLEELIPGGEEDVPWERVAAVLVSGRFCGQVSELGIAERWYQSTALEDLLGVPWHQINEDRLYRGLDQLHQRKDQLTTHLLERYRSWFGVGFEFLIYDITSSYFEGQAQANAQAQRGHSRDHRPDCKQVCIGLVVSPEGLPLAYEVFPGNRNDVTTVEEIVTMMEHKYGQAQRIWVMDRGMVSQKTLEFLRARRAQYIVGTPKKQLRQFEQWLLEDKDWQAVREDVEVKLVTAPDASAGEQYVLCRSAARRQKEKAMLDRQEHRLFNKLYQIHASLEKKPKRDVATVERRVGKWMGRYPAAEKLFQVSIDVNPAGAACGLTIACRLDRSQWTKQAHGAYLLRTNCRETDPAKFWQWYMQLSQAEAAFRTAKSDLRLRPLFHHKEERVQAHILVCFLSLALWRVLEMWMKGKGLGTCARQLVSQIATVKSMDVVLPVRQGEQTVDLRLRMVAKPDRLVAELLQRLDLQLPNRSRVVENAVENVVTKIAP
jgi:transposase